MTDKIGFIGIGAMGAPMAMRLRQAGFDVAVCDVLPVNVDAFVAAHGGRAAKSPADAAAWASMVFTSVINDRDVQAVTQGSDGVFAALKPGAIVVDHSTVSAKLVRELAEDAKRRGLGFVDAPVTISNSGAAKGKPQVMAGGDADALAKVMPLMQTYADSVRHMGPSGAGQLCKMTLSFLMAGIMAGLNEGLTLGFRGGIAAPELVAALMKTPARSWWLEARGPVMLETSPRASTSTPVAPRCWSRTWVSGSANLAWSTWRCPWPDSSSSFRSGRVPLPHRQSRARPRMPMSSCGSSVESWSC
ncbi:MAG: NAD(P)-dependent oxidoreductase [Rhodospirillales bacterium]|nr:NAD(P)-dependent oxidoreductase [Rhodospirillales bacterium]